MSPDDPLWRWLEALERRHLQDLTFPELRRAVQALNRRYVERPGADRAPERVFDGAGKRAAFAVFYSTLHALGIRRLVEELSGSDAPPDALVDLGCGTGAAGIGWALALDRRRPRILGVDRNGWALGEARWNWSRLGLQGTARRGDLVRLPLPGAGHGLVAAFAVNELPASARTTMLERLLDAAARGARVLIVEPIARRPVPWWDAWRTAATGAGGRADLWRLPLERPPLLARLDRAAGLDHAVWTARSLWL